MFLDSHRKRVNCSTNLLLPTGASQKIYNTLGSTCIEMLYGVGTISNCICKLLSLTSTPCVIMTHITLFTWLVPDKIVKKGGSDRGVDNIRSDFTL